MIMIYTPLPPPYTPTQPTSDYTPRGYQPVPTDDYTTTPTAPSSDVPSEPPSEYTPSVSTDDPLIAELPLRCLIAYTLKPRNRYFNRKLVQF